MMSKIMKATSEDAQKHAIDLGIGMQLTNIARDVYEDAKMGRVYLPNDWLAQAGLSREDILRFTADPKKIFQVIDRLLELADRYYQSGKQGLKYLPFRAAIAVGVAAEIYAEIGRKVCAQGYLNYGKRAVVSFPKKLLIMVKETVRITQERLFA